MIRLAANTKCQREVIARRLYKNGHVHSNDSLNRLSKRPFCSQTMADIRHLNTKARSSISMEVKHHPNSVSYTNIMCRKVLLGKEGGYRSHTSPFVTLTSSFSSTSTTKKKRQTTKRKTKATKGGRTIEEQYSRKTPIEHILLRPGMYVGPVERCPPTSCWIPHPVIPPSSSSLPHDIPSSSSSKLHMIHSKGVSFTPALIKMFDEILVNAFDNRLRPATNGTTSTSQIDVVIYPGGYCDNDNVYRPPFISIQNDGRGIPIQIHKKEQMYLPEMLFGHLLTGSNFDDHVGDSNLTAGHAGSSTDNSTNAQDRPSSRGKVTGGRHGYGAKLTNIFSKSFQVDTYDSVRRKRYSQRWEDNMGTMYPPEITVVEDDGGDFTRISFVPDMEKLSPPTTGSDGGGVNEVIPPDDYAIMCRRVMDVAGCSRGKLTVTLNGTPMPISSFEDYANLYREGNTPGKKKPTSPPPPLHFQRINSRWEVGVGLSTTNRSPSFEHTSFVNGISTPRGGTHVDVIVKQITKKITDKILKLYPELEETVNPSLVRRHLCVFVNCLVVNPTFDSQMKECLTSSPGNFGSRYNLSEAFLNGLCVQREKEGEEGTTEVTEDGGGPGIIEQVVRAARGRQQANLLREVGGAKKTRRQLLSIPKLDDAHLAGRVGTNNHSRECTLILTEGDSAKALAVAGMEIIGRERYGVFPLRGKFLNVREAKLSQLTNNHEVKAVCSILGLDFDVQYDTMAERGKLRYGHVMLMTDQDADGSHIKGLLINFFRHFWPHLLKPAVDCPDGKPFLSSFVTPLLKVTKKKKGKRAQEVKSFFSFAEYNKWRQSLSEDDNDNNDTEDKIKKWKVKYYKGLGTSSQAEAKEYFKAFDKHYRPFRWSDDNDGQLIDMVFTKARANDRRDWLKKYDESTSVLHDIDQEQSVSFANFIDKEMIHFSNADNIRSLPSVIDGLKPSQRKVLHACFKRNLTNEIKVAQLTGYCAEHTAYHHGEASLHSTITSMAQDFVGSNNINLLVPSGQFGTRMSGGKDAASPRYIFTKLSPMARLLFPEGDDSLLAYLEDDGVDIEPKYFVPILPLLLLNGSHGIGTGWSTSIPSHSARDVWEYVRAKLDEEEKDKALPSIKPWVKGFTGRLVRREDGKGYASIGKVKKISKTSVLISELPVGRWTNDYKNYLIKMQRKGEIQSFIENHTTSTVSFTITMKSMQLVRMEKSGLEKVFKLETNLLITNMHAFDQDNNITRYESPESIADAHFTIRLGLYHHRKEILERTKEFSANVKRNKARFIEDVIKGEIDFFQGKKTKLETVNQLKHLNFQTIDDLQVILSEEGSDIIFGEDTNMKGLNSRSDPKDEYNLKQFDYLLNLPFSSLTVERISALRSDAARAENELISMKNATPEALWRADLDKLKPFILKLQSK